MGSKEPPHHKKIKGLAKALGTISERGRVQFVAYPEDVIQMSKVKLVMLVIADDMASVNFT